MAQEPIDYEAVLADLETKRATIETAITGIRAIAKLQAHADFIRDRIARSGGVVPPMPLVDALQALKTRAERGR